MSVEKTGTLVVGGGQAGIAMSEHLSNCGEPHLVLERNRIAERWRTERWDSLMANGPAWHDRFPNLEFSDVAPDGFASKTSVTRYFEQYAKMVNAPIRCGVDVLSVQKKVGASGFEVETSEGRLEATNIVAATGPFQHPVIPPIIPESADVLQIHSNSYHNVQQLPDGAVLVVGAGSSGSQIADELMRAGKQVFLSVGPHQRPPRSYRGRDFCWWLGVLGKWDTTTMEPGKEHVTIAVSGSHGGFTVDFRRLAMKGMTLVGLTDSYNDGTVYFAADLADNIAEGDANYLSLLQEADAYIERNGLDLPLEPQAHHIDADPACVANPIRELNLKEAGITSVIWATGYSVDYRWLKADVFHDNGKPIHERGVSGESGIYFLGLPWQSRRGSAFIWGVWHDAKYLADQIAKQKSYINYRPKSL
ncbi:FAD-dependent oxidoreductase [Chromatiales bacterium (ex Bugula neritina AB1)]|nr:FAD-dependent oxidoreductase [Chromatiales bacterium (ex Bugula neritina AB1)]